MLSDVPSIRILLGDGETIFREGLRRLLAAEPGFLVVGEAADGSQVVARTRELDPDVLLLDPLSPKISGFDALRELWLQNSELHTKTILLTRTVSPNELVQAIKLGVKGIVSKASSTDLLLKAIRTVVAGQYWIGRQDVGSIIEFIQTGVAQCDGPLAHELTKRQLEILKAISAGLSNKEIACKLSISEDTVKHHITNLFDKLGVSSRVEIALFAINNHLIENPNPRNFLDSSSLQAAGLAPR